jgi:molybdopterin converting factor small subunit
MGESQELNTIQGLPTKYQNIFYKYRRILSSGLKRTGINININLKGVVMKINLEFLGFPMVSDLVGKKKLELNISGTTVKDVIDELVNRYGKKVRDAFYDTQGDFDLMIQIALNGKSFIPPEKHNISLNEGDTLVFMLLLGGG